MLEFQPGFPSNRGWTGCSAFLLSVCARPASANCAWGGRGRPADPVRGNERGTAVRIRLHCNGRDLKLVRPRGVLGLLRGRHFGAEVVPVDVALSLRETAPPSAKFGAGRISVRVGLAGAHGMQQSHAREQSVLADAKLLARVGGGVPLRLLQPEDVVSSVVFDRICPLSGLQGEWSARGRPGVGSRSNARARGCPSGGTRSAPADS